MQSIKNINLDPATAGKVAAAAVLTWVFSAMQCSKEYCYTTDNPIMQVLFASAVAVGVTVAVTSKPVLARINGITLWASPQKTQAPETAATMTEPGNIPTLRDAVGDTIASPDRSVNTPMSSSREANSPDSPPRKDETDSETSRHSVMSK